MLHCMSDLKMHIPETEEVDIDEQTRAAVDKGIQDANSGRSVSVDDVRKMIPKWLSKFASQKQR
jgi:predicted transcriptional regulator